MIFTTSRRPRPVPLNSHLSVAFSPHQLATPLVLLHIIIRSCRAPSPVASEHVIKPQPLSTTASHVSIFPPCQLSLFCLPCPASFTFSAMVIQRISRPWTAGRTLPICRVAAATAIGRPVGGRTRCFHVAPVLMPPLIFGGLFVALWSWKCAMMVLFQNAIIYNPFLPPNARSMRIDEFSRECGGVQWREERIRSLDGTEIALCVSDMPASSTGAKKPVYILYFQGLSHHDVFSRT